MNRRDRRFNDAGKVILYRVDGTRLIPIAAAFVGHWAQGVAFSADSRTILVGNMVEGAALGR
jgi:hypothetical protein